MNAIENMVDPLPEIHKQLQGYKEDLSLETVTNIMKNTPNHFIALK